MNDFWKEIDAQLDRVEAEGKTVADVLRILGRGEHPEFCSGDGFFGGSGGDRQLLGALRLAGWTVTKLKAHYYYVVENPAGELLTYCEGDVYEGDKMADWND